jgi:competence protein ComEA
MILGRAFWGREFPLAFECSEQQTINQKEEKMAKTKRLAFLCIAVAIVMVFIGPAWAVDGAKINLNKATVEELIQLKGIGQKYAERIIQFREKSGPFEKTEDLMNVPGIGPKIWEKNKDRIVVE